MAFVALLPGRHIRMLAQLRHVFGALAKANPGACG